MDDLFIRYVSVLPEEKIILELMEAMDNYISNKNPLTTKNLKVNLMMMVTKLQIEGKNINEFIDDVKHKKNLIDTFSPLNPSK